MEAITTMTTLKAVCVTGTGIIKFVQALIKYIDYIEDSNKIKAVNDILEQVKDILLQDEKDESLKFTRVITHLETAYRRLLETKKQKTLFSKNQVKVQHKINQVCYALAMIHKMLGNSQDVVMKYAVKLTSLNNPVSSDHLPNSSDREAYADNINFVMLDEDLRFLLTEEQYKQFRQSYNIKITIILEKEREEERRREERIPLFDDYDPLL